MSYSKELTRLAWTSEQSLGRLVDEQAAQNQRSQALDALEEALEGASADGVIDARELEALASLSDAAGTQSFSDRLSSLEGQLDETAMRAAKEELSKSLREAKLENEAGSTTRQLLLQLGMSEMKSLYESASSASRTEHQAYMTAIGNMKA